MQPDIYPQLCVQTSERRVGVIHSKLNNKEKEESSFSTNCVVCLFIPFISLHPAVSHLHSNRLPHEVGFTFTPHLVQIMHFYCLVKYMLRVRKPQTLKRNTSCAILMAPNIWEKRSCYSKHNTSISLIGQWEVNAACLTSPKKENQYSKFENSPTNKTASAKFGLGFVDATNRREVEMCRMQFATLPTPQKEQEAVWKTKAATLCSTCETAKAVHKNKNHMLKVLELGEKMVHEKLLCWLIFKMKETGLSRVR